MLRKNILAAAVATVFVLPASAFAADDAEIKKIREEIDSIKDGYETRIRQLEQRLEKAEQGAGTAKPAATAQSAPASANAFNPAISLILGGQFNNLQRDPETYQIGGFIPGGDEIGPGNRSFNLGESELTVSANIDPYFSGYFVMAVNPENEVEVEEGFVQNTGVRPGRHAQVRPLPVRLRLSERNSCARLGFRRCSAGAPGILRRATEGRRPAGALAGTHPGVHRIRLGNRARRQFPGLGSQQERRQLRDDLRACRRRCRHQQQLSVRCVLSSYACAGSSL